MIPKSLEHEPPIPNIDEPGIDGLAMALNRNKNRTLEQKAQSRQRVMTTVRRGRPIPEGRSLSDVVAGTWPGDESDEQINEALKSLS